ncbi:MAG TPA: CPBP family intramembrane glutamic endopeptidase [Steroidobacteraceae bacterium]|nr:CPBP family intramembrane glutamic endopeptidase [Steroidobacteraceae bacterium]
MTDAPTQQPRRLVSAVELTVGAAIVLGHNVWRVVPNEVLILAALAIVSMRLRAARWDFRTLGFHRPRSWRLIILVALAAAALRILLSDFVIEPATSAIWPPPELPEGAHEIAGNLRNALLALALVWTFAAFGEELAYRGYLLNRAAEAFGGTATAFWLAAVVSAVLFGYGHFYKGPAGILDSGVAGLILAAAYLMTGRNLWTCILAHGFIDTFAVAWLYFGLPD